MKSQTAEKQAQTIEGELEVESRQGKDLAPHQQAGGIAQAVQRGQNAAALMHIIERIGEMPDLTPEKLDQVERLIGMYQQAEDRVQEQIYNEAMARAQSEIQSVAARKTNTHTSSTYADLAAVHEQAKPIWTKHGFSVVTRIGKSEHASCLRVICEVRHSGGHKEIFDNDWPLDNAGSQGKTNKTAIQAMGSTSSYARRYTELGVFDIAVEHDDDGNGGRPAQRQAGDQQQGQQANQPPRRANTSTKPITPNQVGLLRNKLKHANKSEADLCKAMEVQQLEQIQMKNMDGALDWISS